MFIKLPVVYQEYRTHQEPMQLNDYDEEMQDFIRSQRIITSNPDWMPEEPMDDAPLNTVKGFAYFKKASLALDTTDINIKDCITNDGVVDSERCEVDVMQGNVNSRYIVSMSAGELAEVFGKELTQEHKGYAAYELHKTSV